MVLSATQSAPARAMARVSPKRIALVRWPSCSEGCEIHSQRAVSMAQFVLVATIIGSHQSTRPTECAHSVAIGVRGLRPQATASISFIVADLQGYRHSNPMCQPTTTQPKI